MPLIEWSPGLSVKINEIDAQHKKLFDLINSLHDAMRAGKGRVVLGQTLSELVSYTQYHFSTEERLFQQYQYPAYAEHKQEHDVLTSQVKELKAQFDAGDTMITIDVMNFLVNWLNNHIKGSDLKYSPFLTEKGAI